MESRKVAEGYVTIRNELVEKEQDMFVTVFDIDNSPGQTPEDAARHIAREKARERGMGEPENLSVVGVDIA